MDLGVYGARDAAQNWTEEYTKTLRDMGFIVGIASPCNFVCQDKELYVSVHGDDFTIVGPTKEFEWMRSNKAKAYEITGEFFGFAGGIYQSERSICRLTT